MEFGTSNAPPAGHSCISQKTRYDLSPDQGLHVCRSDKILFQFTEHVWKVRQGSDQISAAACGRAFAEYLWSLPNVFYAEDCLTAKIMRTREKGVIVEDLSARRFIVRIVQSNERVS